MIGVVAQIRVSVALLFHLKALDHLPLLGAVQNMSECDDETHLSLTIYVLGIQRYGLLILASISSVGWFFILGCVVLFVRNQDRDLGG